MREEEIALEPLLPIIDPHLHLWDIRAAPGALQAPQRFLLDDAVQTIARSGHAITHSVYIEAHAMYRQDGPLELRSLGETEFANGMAAMSASGGYGDCRIAHRIVANADLRLGACVAAVLEKHRSAAGERFAGVRTNTAYRERGLFGYPCDPSIRHVMLDPNFCEGARALAEHDLSLDVWCLHTQLGELCALADALPNLRIILDHLGTPESFDDEARKEWAKAIAELARRPNVLIKLGGLGMDVSRPIQAEIGSRTSRDLAEAWRPFIEMCIDAFTPQRSMFESNYPPDKDACSYGAIWNAFKLIAREHSQDEKDQLFRRTAANTYRIALS